jgi:outer membrane protein assembly factor BamA
MIRLKNGWVVCFFMLGLIFLSLFSFGQKDSNSHSRHLLILPLVAKSIETNWSFGIANSFTFHISKKDSSSRTSNLQSITLYSLRKQFVAAINGTIYFPGEKYILNEQLSYSSFPDKFWGLGKKSLNSDVEPYTFQQFYIYLHGQRSLGKNLFLGLLYEYQRLLKVSYTAGGLFEQQDIVGRNGYHISGLGLSFTYDNRNNAFAPDKGQFMQVYFNHFNSFLGSDYKYTNYVLDVRKYLRLYKSQVLALQLFGFYNSGIVPLRSLASFGGANSMRGYYDGRYRDYNQLVFQAEYRMPLFWRLGGVLFAGSGDVSRRFNDYNLASLKYSYGAGIRIALNKKERLNLRIDYGFGQHGSNGLYFQLGEAF